MKFMMDRPRATLEPTKLVYTFYISTLSLEVMGSYKKILRESRLDLDGSYLYTAVPKSSSKPGRKLSLLPPRGVYFRWYTRTNMEKKF